MAINEIKGVIQAQLPEEAGMEPLQDELWETPI